MKEQRLNYFRVFVLTQMNYIPCFCILMLAAGIMGAEEVPAGILLAPGVFSFWLYLIRMKCEGMLSFTLGHLLSLLFLWFLLNCFSSGNLLFLMFLVLAAYTGLSVYYKAGKPDREPSCISPVAGIAIMVMTYFVQNTYGNRKFQTVLFLISAGYLCLHFLYNYLSNFITFLILNRTSTGHMKEKQLFSAGMAMVGGYTLFTGLTLIFCTDPGAGDRLAAWLKALCFRFLRWIASLLSKENTGEYVEETPPQTMVDIEPRSQGEETISAWPEIVRTILDALVIILFLVIVAAAVYWLIKAFIALFKKRSEEAGPRKDTKERIAHVKKIKNDTGDNKKRIFYRFSPNAKIRRVYGELASKYRKKLEQEKGKPAEASTARENCRVLAVNNPPAGEQLAQLYEKARYSNQSCNKKEVKEARAYAGKLKG